MKYLLLLLSTSLLVSCSDSRVSNASDDALVFSDIQSDYKVTDANDFGCEKVNQAVIEHILQTGITISPRDVHDYYSTLGCNISGTLMLAEKKVKFSFDYGGVIRIGNDLIIGCAQECCKREFPYCTWEAASE